MSSFLIFNKILEDLNPKEFTLTVNAFLFFI